MEELEEVMVHPMEHVGDVTELLLRFFFNCLVIWIVIHLLYYPKSKKREYYFTFALISVSVFFLIYLLGSVKIKVGFALGLFAIFGIIRYRTESMSVRDMTYLFVIIAISVINALAAPHLKHEELLELLVTNVLFVGVIALCESLPGLHRTASKLVLYDRIDLIVPEKRSELMADLHQRLGLEIEKIEIGAVDFLRDTVMLKVFYHVIRGTSNSVNRTLKLPKEDI